jgi:hypothetical protein
MAYSTEQLAEFAAKAAELRSRAHKLEEEQSKLNQHGTREGDRYWQLGIEIGKLRAEAHRIYEPVLAAMEEDLKNKR